VPKKANPAKDRPLYRRKPPKPESLGQNLLNPQNKNPQSGFRNPQFIAPAHFTLREDGSIVAGRDGVPPSQIKNENQGQRHAVPPNLIISMLL
jgi:hypothetical protein